MKWLRIQSGAQPWHSHVLAVGLDKCAFVSRSLRSFIDRRDIRTVPVSTRWARRAYNPAQEELVVVSVALTHKVVS